MAYGGKVEHRLVDTAMGIQSEIVCSELGSGVRNSDGIQQHSTEDRYFVVDRGGETFGRRA